LTFSGPTLLTSEHRLEGFDCGEPALNDWLARRALGNQAAGTSRTWVVIDEPARMVVAYYASSTASVMRAVAPRRVARDQPADLPAILLGRMAVDHRHQGKGLGAAMLKHFMTKAIEVSEKVGVQLVLVHAKDERARDFYLHHGFIESPIDSLTLMMLLPFTDRDPRSTRSCRDSSRPRPTLNG
jgi:GNAT superfamily N-acetyltransferase